ILTITKRTKGHPALNDFSGTRIAQGRSVRPPAGRTMHPLDYVVTNVHRVRVFGHDFDTKSVTVAGGFKRLVPPARAFNQSRPHRLRRAPVDVVNNRIDWFTHRGRRIFLLQSMMID